MRYARIVHQGAPRFGAADGGGTIELYTDAPWLGGVATGERVPLDEGALLAPVTPSKIVCIGKNYAAHAREMGGDVPKSPLIFLKAPTALIDPGAAIELPPESERVEHEGELAVVIGKKIRRASLEETERAIFGLTIANDVTARDLQRADVQFTRAKSFDTFCPVGPYVVAGLDPRMLTIEVRVGGEVRQRGRTSDMIFPVTTLVRFVSDVMTLHPGDLLLTGTPEGVGPLRAGDVVSVTIDGIGTLSNPVVDAR